MKTSTRVRLSLRKFNDWVLFPKPISNRDKEFNKFIKYLDSCHLYMYD